MGEKKKILSDGEENRVRHQRKKVASSWFVGQRRLRERKSYTFSKKGKKRERKGMFTRELGCRKSD